MITQNFLFDGIDQAREAEYDATAAEDRFEFESRTESALAVERHDARVQAIADAIAAFMDLTPLLDGPTCDFCGGAAEAGENYCSLICAIDAEEN